MPSAFSLLLFVVLLIPPGPALKHLTIDNVFYRPIQATMLPASAFANLPPTSFGRMEVARSLERIAWSWAALAGLGSIWRSVSRIRQGATGEGAVHGLKPHSILGVRPVWRSIAAHLIAWRLGSMQNRKLWPLMGQQADLVSILGTAAGLICLWGEMLRLAKLFGWNRDPGSGPSWTLSIVHIGFTVLRLVLSWRLLVAAMTTLQLSLQTKV